MPHKATRRLLDIDVNEISLVDKAANEKKFFIIKRDAKEEAMDKEVKTVVEKDATEDVAEEKKEPKTTESEPDNVVEKAMDKVTGLIEGIVAKAENSSSEENSEESSEESSEEISDETSDETSGESSDEPETDQVTKTLEALHVAIGTAKRLTPDRTDKLNEVADLLKQVVGEISPSEEVAKSVKSDNGVEQIVKSISTLTETIKAQFEKVESTTKELSDRVGTIEETRKASTSLEDEAETDSKKPVEKSLWKGIL